MGSGALGLSAVVWSLGPGVLGAEDYYLPEYKDHLEGVLWSTGSGLVSLRRKGGLPGG